MKKKKVMEKSEIGMEKKMALAGNPNVGKSTVFNALTGMHQHTGNWPGKTVSNAIGICEYQKETYHIYDLPGTYSLIAHSAEEEVARDFICFGDHDIVVVVCDAVCLERNLNLVLQTIEITKHVVVCVNLLDEAKKKKISVNLEKLSKELGVPVVGTSARSNKGLDTLMSEVKKTILEKKSNAISINYPEPIEKVIHFLEPYLPANLPSNINRHWLALQLMDNDNSLMASLKQYLGYDLLEEPQLLKKVGEARQKLLAADIISSELKDVIAKTMVEKAEQIANRVVTFEKLDYAKRDRKIDRILTNKWTGIPIMLLLLMVIFWITIVGANYPSQLLFDFLFQIEDHLTKFFLWLGTPSWVHGILVLGIYRVLAWVVAVMLPPMTIFFPLFTLLEDLGYLPRIAFNLDKYFKKCCACGKQALTMCMGFGCNAVGVTGCRIIDSPRERLIAILTNSFVPCNGRYPTMISIITMFFIGFGTGILSSFGNVLLLMAVILLGIFMTFLVSKILSKTILKGVPSSFALELPPYRRPQVGKVIIRSIFDRTLFVLGRAVAIAAPAGLLIWILANIQIGDMSLLNHCAEFLNPFAQLFGLDGVILMAFILGFPANEIVIPIMIMAYMSTGHISDFSNLWELKSLLVQNDWTWLTALCVMIFSLFHWPCSTTCLTIKKETGSWRWTLLAIILPTLIGFVLCLVITQLSHLFGLIG